MPQNPFLMRFHDDLRARYPQDGAEMSDAEWICLNTKLGGRKFSFAGHEFQRAIADDRHPDLSVMKLSQVGLTEVQVRKFLTLLARNRGTKGIFTFPNEKMFKANSKTRIKPVVNQPAFKSTAIEDDKPHRAMNLYEINGSFAHITGMTEGDATSINADFLIHDEYDLSDQAMIALFQSRLQHSTWKVTQKFSTPSHAGYGIDAAYQASDQLEFMVRCPACNHWNLPDFDLLHMHLAGYKGSEDLENMDVDVAAGIDFRASYVKCEKCSRPLDLANPALREWVPRHPGRLARGYRVRCFSTDLISIQYIVQQLLKMRQLDNIRGWKNTVLGQTHSDGDSKLEPDDIRAVMTERVVEIGSDVPLAYGCDMGKTCHLTLGVIRGDQVFPVHFEQVPANDVVDRTRILMERYNIITGGVDRMPYTPTAEQIREVSKGVILPIQYTGSEHVQLVKDEYDVLDFVKVNRTRVIDDMVKAVRRKLITISGYGSLESVMVEQLCDMVRVEVPDRPATWEKLTGNDHFMHSLVLQRVSLKVRELKLMLEDSNPRQFFGIIPVATERSTRKPY